MNMLFGYYAYNQFKKFALRLFIIFTVHLVIAAGDESLLVWEISWYRTSFSIFFFTYWLLIWYGAEYVNLSIYKRQDKTPEYKSIFVYILFLINFLIGLLSAFIANLLFRFGSVKFFGQEEEWSVVPIFNPELTLGLFSFYMMIFTADIYFSSTIKSKEDQLKMEKMKRENMKAQYLVLKSQLDPHFLFNSLSVLTSIIHTDIKLAEEFILRLSKTLRYAIEKNEMTIIPLKEEIQFVNDYFFLINNRFEGGIIFVNSIEKSIIKESYIPPASIQLLIENAVKHNRFSPNEPLQIKLYNDKDKIIVENNINKRDDQMNSTKQGLQNLTQRVSYFSEKVVSISQNETKFIVSIPILTKEDYESFDF